MLSINLQNIEELLLSDKHVKNMLPDLRHVFDQWLFSQKLPYLRSLRVRSQMDLLNGLTTEHLDKLEAYFQDTILLGKIDYHIVKNKTLPLDFIADRELSEFDGFGNLAISRDERQVYVSCWR